MRVKGVTKVLQRGQSVAITMDVSAVNLSGKFRIMTAMISEMKLQILDTEDLSVLSAQCQDATVRVADLAYLPSERRFAMVCNRFDWLGAQAKRKGPFQRYMAGLRFERVDRAQVSGFSLTDTSAVLVLLAIEFMPKLYPAGQITLLFAAGAAIRLEVEFIEAELKDLGSVWQTKHKPDHVKSDHVDDRFEKTRPRTSTETGPKSEA